jgi:hypothetical protein
MLKRTIEFNIFPGGSSIHREAPMKLSPFSKAAFPSQQPVRRLKLSRPAKKRAVEDRPIAPGKVR